MIHLKPVIKPISEIEYLFQLTQQIKTATRITCHTETNIPILLLCWIYPKDSMSLIEIYSNT